MATENDKLNLKENFNQKIIAGYTIRDLSIKISFFFILIIFIPLLFPTGRSLKYTDLQTGSIVNKKVIAPFTFPVLKTDEQLLQDRNEAVSKIPLYFNYKENMMDLEIQRL